jgi:hypothetical protein
LEKGHDVIVVQIGSHSIKMNFANQTHPLRIRNIIAYKLKKGMSTSLKSEIADSIDPELEKIEQ